ncbi:MAG: hypothetical protein KGN84_09190 [Acidobacteriota bacterium]|nr:hypothetical protein [Acidobacteriota bacterium]
MLCRSFDRFAFAVSIVCWVRPSPAPAQTLDRLIPHSVELHQVTYQGRAAVQVVAVPDAANGASYAILRDSHFRDGTITVDVAGKPAGGAFAEARGFIGIAFRLRENRYEYIYLRPTNGRADDQVRRNHSVQYGAYPDFDYAESRRVAPEKYESYADLQPGVWTKYRIEVEGRKARLYVGGADQPCLIVDDLKHDPAEGEIALWVGPGTEGYFSGLTVSGRSGVAAAAPPAADARTIYFDRAHGEARWPPQMTDLQSRVGFVLKAGAGPIASDALAGSRLLYLRAPSLALQEAEKKQVIDFVRRGGSLLIVLDEEHRQKLAVVGVNDVIEPFGLRLSGDTPNIVNTGAIAKAGEIDKADREVPYDGGREVFGGTPFAYQLDRAGKPAQPYASYVKLDNGARIVVMGEGMASLFLGEPGAARLTVDPANPKWWGKDSAVFMEEVLTWLLAR